MDSFDLFQQIFLNLDIITSISLLLLSVFYLTNFSNFTHFDHQLCLFCKNLYFDTFTLNGVCVWLKDIQFGSRVPSIISVGTAEETRTFFLQIKIIFPFYPLQKMFALNTPFTFTPIASRPILFNFYQKQSMFILMIS